MVIIEGPDGSGKSVLVDHLAQKFGLPVVKVVRSDTTPVVNNLAQWTSDSLSEGLQRRIFDRHAIISEPIYAAALRHRLKPGFDERAWWQAQYMKLTKLRPFLVYCLPPLSEVVANCMRHDTDNAIIEGKAEVIYGAYISKAAQDISLGRAVSHDYTFHGSEDRVATLVDHWLHARGL